MKKSELLHAYKLMKLSRTFGTRAAEMYTKGKIGGFCHLYTGEEAVAVGSLWSLRDDDVVLGSYRDHVYYLVRGGDPARAMAELYGHSDGCCKGKGGSMHLFDSERKFYGGYAIVAGECPIAVGVAKAIQIRKTDQVVLCFFGDGATNQGVYHESLNMAGLWKLPIVFVCENNKYAIGTSVQRSSAEKVLAKKAAVYGMPAEQVNGMDFLKMVSVTGRAVKRARSGKGPSFIEAKCYRYRGHSMSDPAKYRTKEEEKFWKKRDAIERLKELIRYDFEVGDEVFKEIDKQVNQEIDRAVEAAEAGQELPSGRLYEDVYVD